MIETHGVELRYGAHAALGGVDVTVPARGLTAIVGASGSGKSSLLYVLSGLRRPTAGEVRLDGRPLSRYSGSALRSERFSFVFQDHYLLMHLNGFENVVAAFAKPTHEARVRSARLLATLGLGSASSRSAWRLSGGERQRIAVARALARPSAYVFADEPTAALDRESVRIVYDILREVARTQAVVLVTHDPKALELADAIIHLRDGVVADRARV
jgi:putative ABC transport system ATP-binding protein